MAVAAAGILAPALLEYDDLAAAALIDHFCNYAGTFHGRSANGCVRAVANHEHFVKRDGAAGFGVEFLDPQEVVCGNRILFATGFDYSEHVAHVLLFVFDTGTALWLMKHRLRSCRTQAPAPSDCHPPDRSLCRVARSEKPARP